MEFNLATIYESLARAIPDSTALVCGERRLTYRDLDLRANRLADSWRRRGLGEGSHIGLLLYNSAEFIEAMLAALKLRAAPINVNYRYVAEELGYLFDNADLDALVYQRNLADRVRAALPRRPAMRELLWVAAGEVGEEDAAAIGEDFEAAMAAGAAEVEWGPRSGDDRYLIYTGGTTGMPRGVIWRQEDLFYAGLQGGAPGGEPYQRASEVAENVSPEGGMNMHPAPPLIHGASQFASWISFCTGGKVALVPGRSFDAARTCAILEEEAISVMQIVGDAMALPIVEDLERQPRALPGIVCVTSAGAILSGEIRRRLERCLPDTMIMNNFGASETGHQGTAFYETPESKPRWIMDERTTVLGPDDHPIEAGSGVVGRLARSGRLPQGYYKDPEKTARTFVTLHGTRYVLAGDLATIDAEGSIQFLGRGAMCVNTGGEKVFPEEVEEALKDHPDVADAVVVGVPDPRWGERVEALVRPREGAPLAVEALEAWCRGRVAGYKVPRRFHVLVHIERHPSGKPDYRWAKDVAVAAADAALSDVTTLDVTASEGA